MQGAPHPASLLPSGLDELDVSQLERPARPPVTPVPPAEVRATTDLLIPRPDLGANAWTQVPAGEVVPPHLVERIPAEERRAKHRRKTAT